MNTHVSRFVYTDQIRVVENLFVAAHEWSRFCLWFVRSSGYPFFPQFKMGDRYNIHSQLEHLQSKYIGTGHADTNKWEWLTNQHRDSYASYLGHFDMLNYFSIVENESKARVRFNLMEKMLQPCGPPPERPED